MHYDVNLFRQEYQSQLDDFDFIRGHLNFHDVVDFLSTTPRLLIFLRDPIVRFISFYEMRARVADPLVGLQSRIQALSLDEFLEDDDLMSRFTNQTSHFLTAAIRDTPVTYQGEDMLSLAKENLAKFDFIGLTEHFDESLEMVMYMLGFPQILEYKTLNVSPKRERRQEISQSTLDRIAELNADDVALYEYSLELYRAQKERYDKEIANPSETESVIDIKPIQTTTAIDLNRLYPGQGLHIAEHNPDFGIIRWTGPQATSRIYLQIDSSRTYRIQLQISQIPSETLDSLRISINDLEIPLTSYFMGSPILNRHIIEAVIPQGIQPVWFGHACLELNICETKVNEDGRLLGMCIHQILVTPLNVL